MSCEFLWFPELLIVDVKLLSARCLVSDLWGRGVTGSVERAAQTPSGMDDFILSSELTAPPPSLFLSLFLSLLYTHTHADLRCELGRPSWPVVSPQACRERDVLPTAKVNNSAPDSAGPVSPLQLWFNQVEGEVKPDAALPTGWPGQITQTQSPKKLERWSGGMDGAEEKKWGK